MDATPSLRDGSDIGQEDSRRRVFVLGYLRGSSDHGLDCEQPLQVMSLGPDGYAADLWLCGATKASRCRPCAGRYRRRVRAVAETGFRRPPLPGQRFYFVTVTPPGEHAHCMKAGCQAAPFCRHEKCRCTPVGGVDLGEWNASAGKAWNRLLTGMKNHYGSRPEYFRPVETQKRGGLHKHPLMVTNYPIDEREFRQLAIDAGFGHEVRVVAVDGKSPALIEYVTKRVAGYVSKSVDERSDVPWRRDVVDESTGEVTVSTDPTFRTWSQSRGWGQTMRSIRREARLVALELKSLRESAPKLVGGVVQVVSETPPAPS